jgi:hypothetical protein
MDIREMPIQVVARSCWDYGFESRQGHGCLSLVSVVCGQVQMNFNEVFY